MGENSSKNEKSLFKWITCSKLRKEKTIFLHTAKEGLDFFSGKLQRDTAFEKELWGKRSRKGGDFSSRSGGFATPKPSKKKVYFNGKKAL